jgi:hypothetical protein
MKIFSILALAVALIACAPAVFDPSNGIPMGANETWNLKIQSKTGAVLLNENYKLSGSFRTWSQTQNLPPRGSNSLVEIKVTEVYTTGLLKFYIIPTESIQIAGIRSDKYTGIIGFFASRDQGYKYFQIFSDSYKTRINQDSCSFSDFTDTNRFQGGAVKFQDENSSATDPIGTCTFTKLEPSPK